jgi:hypothetical protein
MLNRIINNSSGQPMTLEEAGAAFIALAAADTINHHHMGQFYNYVVDTQLAENAGHKSALDFFVSKVKDLSRTTLVSYGAVARNFTEEVTVQFGVTCLTLLLTYKEATGLALNPAEPGPTLIEVPGDNNTVVSKPFSDCSVQDLRKALQRKRRPTSSAPLPSSDLALVDQYRKAVTSHFPAHSPVRVSVRNRQGKAIISFDVPLEQVDTLTEALINGLPSARNAA